MASDVQRLLGKVHGRNESPVPSEIDGVRPDPASDFENFLPSPLLEFGESRNMRFHEVFPPPPFVKIFARSYILRRMPNVARPPVPILLDPLDWNSFKPHI